MEISVVVFAATLAPCPSGQQPNLWRRGGRARQCLDCCAIRKDGPGHKFDHPSHRLRALTDEERRQLAAPPTDPGTSGEYKLTFGKHKGKTLAWPQHSTPSYIAWMAQERLFNDGKYPGLREAMDAFGLLPSLPLVA
eukprot:6301390-Alexandrium_andersonii.AAC.1